MEEDKEENFCDYKELEKGKRRNMKRKIEKKIRDRREKKREETGRI